MEISTGFRLYPNPEERPLTIRNSFMSKSYLKNRLIAFRNQNGACYYCSAPMWLREIGSFAAGYGISERQAHRFQCTAEHLIAKQDGGVDSGSNIVAACWFCNQTRHRRRNPLPANKYASLIARRLNSGKWHPKECHPMIANCCRE
jgi:hypothetical protein